MKYQDFFILSDKLFSIVEKSIESYSILKLGASYEPKLTIRNSRTFN